MAEHKIGRLFVELDLDPGRYLKGQQTLRKEATEGAKILEKNFKNLGIKSGATFDLMRAQAIQSFEAIKRSGKATADDLVRAERAKADRIKQINNEQFGHQRTSIDQIKNHWKGAAVAMAAAMATAAAAIYGTIKVMNQAIEAAKEQEAVERRLEAVIKSTGGAAGYNVEQLKQMASAMQKATSVGDEVILGGMSILATFKNIRGEAFERTTKAALDMSEVMQQDLKSSMVMIAKAMNDPIANLSAMTRAGVQFTQTQKDLIKELWEAGKVYEAQNVILEEMESQFGGAAEAARKTYKGISQAVKNARGDAMESLGDIITKNEAVILSLGELEQMWIDLKQTIEDNKKVLMEFARDGLVALVSGIETAVLAIGFLVERMRNISATWLALKRAWLSLEELSAKSQMWAAQLNPETYRKKREELAAVQQAIVDVTNAQAALDERNETTNEQVFKIANALSNLRGKLEDIEVGVTGNTLALDEFDSGFKKANETIVKASKVTKEATENYDHLEKALEGIRKKLLQMENERAWEAQDLYDWVMGYGSVIDQLAWDVESGINESVASIEKGNEKIKTDVKDTVDEMQKLWIKGLNRVQESFADTFYNAMTGELDDLGDVFDSFFKDILRMVAEFAAKMTMYDLFGVGTSGWGSLFSSSTSGAAGGATGGGGSGLFGSLLSLSGSAYQAITGKTFVQTLTTYTPALAEALGIGVSEAMAQEIGALTGGSLATGMNAGLGASLSTTAQGGIMGLIAAAWAVGSTLLGTFLQRQNEGPSSFNTQTKIGTSSKAGELLNMPTFVKAWTSSGEWDEDSARNAANRAATEFLKGLTVYESIFQNISEESQVKLKAAVDALNLEEFDIIYKQMATDNAPISLSIYKFYNEMIQDAIDSLIQDKTIVSRGEFIGSTTTGAQALKVMMQGVFDAYIGEALANIGGTPIFEYMSEEFKEAFGKLDLDLFISDIDEFVRIYGETASNMLAAQKIWDKLENIGKGIDYTKADQLSAMAEAWGNAYKTITEAYTGVTISDEDMAEKVKEYYTAIADGTSDIDRAVEGVTELDVAVGALNGTFDAYIEQLKELGVAVENVTELEAMRMAAMNRLLEDYKHAMGLITDEEYYTTRLNKIWDKYKNHFDSIEDLMSAFYNASVEDINAWLAAIGSTDTWTDVANDMQWLREALEKLGTTTEEVTDVITSNISNLADDIKSVLDGVRGTISGGGGTSTATGLWWQVTGLQSSIVAMVGGSTPEDVYANLEAGAVNLLDMANLLANWYETAVEEATAAAQAWLDAEQESLRADQESIQEQLQVARAFGSLVDSIEQAMQNIRYSTLNVAVPRVKAETAQDEWDTLLLAAKSSGSVEDYQKLVSFSQTALQAYQNEYMSGDKYKTFYEKVMADLEAAKGFATEMSHEEALLQSLADIQTALSGLTIEMAPGFTTTLADIESQFETMAGWIENAIGTAQALEWILTIDWQNFDGTTQDVLEMLEKIVSAFGWEHEVTIEWVSKMATWVANKGELADAIAAMDYIANATGWESKVTLEFVSSYAGALTDIVKAQGFLDYLVSKLGWDATATITFIESIDPNKLFKTMDDLAKAAKWVALESGGWESKATIAFVKNVAANWEFEDIGEALEGAKWIAGQAPGQWTAAATVSFLATLLGRYGSTDKPLTDLNKWLTDMGLDDTTIPAVTAKVIMELYGDVVGKITDVNQISSWLEGMGITDSNLNMKVTASLAFELVQSGSITTAQMAKAVNDMAKLSLAAPADSTAGRDLLKQIEAFASMWGINHVSGGDANTSLLANLKNFGYATAMSNAEANYIWERQSRALTFAEGGLINSPTLGWVGEAGYPEAVIPMKDGINIPVKWINGGSTQSGSDRPVEINLSLEIDGQPLDARIKVIAKNETENVRVNLVRRGQLSNPRRQPV